MSEAEGKKQAKKSPKGGAARTEKKGPEKASKPRIAVILIRGFVDMPFMIEDTIKMLNLLKKHNCAVIPKTPHYMGMVRKAKNYITWGEADAKTLELLSKARKSGDTYHLNPPLGGFERKGIKKPFSKGGALGERGTKINLLIQRMVPK